MNWSGYQPMGIYGSFNKTQQHVHCEITPLLMRKLLWQELNNDKIKKTLTIIHQAIAVIVQSTFQVWQQTCSRLWNRAIVKDV